MINEKTSNEKTCFVIMGFGKKMDFRNTKEIDLDVIYNDVIQKIFKERFPEYILIRADEIAGSQIIDISMYALIMKADLVIADITTMNANAIYELGIRHALKPFSTIIMMQKNEQSLVPFDLSHNRILMYESYDEEISEQEAERIKDLLEEYIQCSGVTDSPMYTVLPEHERPQNIENEYQRVVDKFKKEKNDSSVRIMYEKAKERMIDSDFIGAIEIWKKLCDKLPENPYVVQQQALAQYKSKWPTEEESLDNALHTMEVLLPEQSLDLETLGIVGAIYKRKYKLHRNYTDLDKAISYYQKGYMIKKDYYNGENYAYCLLEKVYENSLSEEETISLRYIANNVFKDLVKTLEEYLSATPEEKINYWIYATLSTSFYYLGNMDDHIRYQKLFYSKSEADWEKQTYMEQLNRLKILLSSCD